MQDKRWYLEKAGMNFSNEKSPKNYTGITVVVLLHVLAAYGIATGLGKRLVTKMMEPVETKIIEEVKPPPPKDLPPTTERVEFTEEAPRPVKNAQGQETGRLINVIA